MSSSTAVNESGRAAAAAQRSAFSQTCSLLSQYVKEKRAIGDLSLGMAARSIDGRGANNDPFRRATTTMNLFPGSSEQQPPAEEASKPLMLPQLNMFKPNSSSSSFSSDGKSAQMTIFYNGQVMVFDDFPAEKAKEIMEMASKGSSFNTSSISPIAAANPVTTTTTTTTIIPTTTVCPSTSNNNLNKEHIQLPTAPTLADLPIARKASLHRFLEKRKDRITANAPYTTANKKPTADEPSKATGAGGGFSSSSWLGLAAAERNLMKSSQQ